MLKLASDKPQLVGGTVVFHFYKGFAEGSRVESI